MQVHCSKTRSNSITLSQFLAADRFAAAESAFARALAAREMSHRAVYGTHAAANAVRDEAIERAIDLAPELIRVHKRSEIIGFSLVRWLRGGR